jgi:hypothetical protein
MVEQHALHMLTVVLAKASALVANAFVGKALRARTVPQRVMEFGQIAIINALLRSKVAAELVPLVWTAPIVTEVLAPMTSANGNVNKLLFTVMGIFSHSMLASVILDLLVLGVPWTPNPPLIMCATTFLHLKPREVAGAMI